jgi:hypothetical protein
MRLMTPPFPAVSRPSNSTTRRLPCARIHSCMYTSSVCNRSSSRSYCLALSSTGDGTTRMISAGASTTCSYARRGLMDLLKRADTYPMIVLAMTATGWLSLMVLIVGACRAARLGDQAPH